MRWEALSGILALSFVLFHLSPLLQLFLSTSPVWLQVILLSSRFPPSLFPSLYSLVYYSLVFSHLLLVGLFVVYYYWLFVLVFICEMPHNNDTFHKHRDRQTQISTQMFLLITVMRGNRGRQALCSGGRISEAFYIDLITQTLSSVATVFETILAPLVSHQWQGKVQHLKHRFFRRE